MKLWEMSISGGILILSILVVRRLFRNKIPKRTFLVLWMVALVRLLAPVSFAVPQHVYTLLGDVDITTQMEQLLESMQPKTCRADILVQGNIGWRYGKFAAKHWMQEYAGSGLEYWVQKSTGGSTKQRMQERAGSDIEDWIQEVAEDGEKDKEPSWDRGKLYSSISVWAVIYVGGVLLCAIFYLFVYLKCYREFRTALPVEDSFIQEWVASFHLRRKVQVRQSDLIATPMTYGIFCPVILLPKGIKWENPQQIRLVLTHEMVHIQKFDVAKKLLFVIAVCIHWCNPLVWVMHVLANRDIELACDEIVLQYFGQEFRTAYALSLISLAERNNKVPSYPACHLVGRMIIQTWGSGFRKDVMEERIVAIMKKKKPTIGAITGAGILVIFVVVLFAASMLQKDTKEDYVVMEKDVVLAEPELVESDKVADLKEISDSSGMILLPVPKKSPSEISNGEDLDSETVYEGEEDSGILQLYQNIYHSEEFLEYEKFGLSYDEKNGHFLYQGEIVGYFKDEMKSGLFRRFVDEEGTIGLTVLRDGSWEMKGFQEKEIKKEIEGEDSGAAKVIAFPKNFITQSQEDEVQEPALGGESEVFLVEFPEEYEDYGIGEEGRYQGKWIGLLYDSGHLILLREDTKDMSEGEIIYLEVCRNAKGEIASLQEMTKEEAEEIVLEHNAGAFIQWD